MAAEMENQAAWILQPKGRLQVNKAEVPTPGEGELLVKIECIAFSPIESKIQRFGTHPIPYPSILGTSFAGSVIEPHASVSDAFPAGSRVAVNRIGDTISDSHFGSFQKYALAKASSTSKLLAGTSATAGGAVAINLAATVSALHLHMGLARPPLSGTAGPRHQKVLVYGGTSQCGALAIKYLAAAGYTVVSTTSPRHKPFVSTLGAAHLIDHSQPADSIGAEIAAHGPYDAGIFDSIGLPPVTDILAAYLGGLPEGSSKSYNTLIPLLGSEKEIPAGVERKFAPYAWAFEQEGNAEARDWFYDEYMPKGLQSGLIPQMPTEAVEGGLEAVQSALDRMGDKKVSGTKLVMDPWA